MLGHAIDDCWRLKHKLQDLIEDETIENPPSKPNTVTNLLQKHAQNPQVNHVSLNSTKFNPSQYIVPLTKPRPIAQIPEEGGVHYVKDMEYEWTIKWGTLVDEWLEREAGEIYAENQPEPMGDSLGIFQVNDEWLDIDVININEDEPEWDPMPNEWQMIKKDDPLDYVTLLLLFMEYEQDVTHDRASPQPFGQPQKNLENSAGTMSFVLRTILSMTCCQNLSFISSISLAFQSSKAYGKTTTLLSSR